MDGSLNIITPKMQWLLWKKKIEMAYIIFKFKITCYGGRDQGRKVTTN